MGENFRKEKKKKKEEKKSMKYKIKKMDKHEEDKLYANNIHFVLWVYPIHTKDFLCYNIHDKT